MRIYFFDGYDGSAVAVCKVNSFDLVIDQMDFKESSFVIDLDDVDSQGIEDVSSGLFALIPGNELDHVIDGDFFGMVSSMTVKGSLMTVKVRDFVLFRNPDMVVFTADEIDYVSSIVSSIDDDEHLTFSRRVAISVNSPTYDKFSVAVKEETVFKLPEFLRTIVEKMRIRWRITASYSNATDTRLSVTVLVTRPTAGGIILDDRMDFLEIESVSDSTVLVPTEVCAFPNTSNTKNVLPVFCFLLKNGEFYFYYQDKDVIVPDDYPDNSEFRRPRQCIYMLFSDTDFDNIEELCKNEISQYLQDMEIVVKMKQNEFIAFSDLQPNSSWNLKIRGKTYQTFLTRIEFKDSLTEAELTFGLLRTSLSDKIRLMDRR